MLLLSNGLMTAIKLQLNWLGTLCCWCCCTCYRLALFMSAVLFAADSRTATQSSKLLSKTRHAISSPQVLKAFCTTLPRCLDEGLLIFYNLHSNSNRQSGQSAPHNKRNFPLLFWSFFLPLICNFVFKKWYLGEIRTQMQL